jgi:hypothetical protein
MLLTAVPSHDNSYLGNRAAKPDTPKSITRNLRNLPIAAPIRSRYMYCNIMYTVATHLVEVKTQKNFSDFLNEQIFQPLDMSMTSLQPASARAKGFGEHIATGYNWDKDNAVYRDFQSPDCPESQGAGSIITSANDFIKWIKCLVNREDPINERVYQGLLRMRSFPNPAGKRLKPLTSPAVYAAGVEAYYYRGHMVVGHDGVITGFGSRFFFLPDFKFGGVILGNSSAVGSVASILVRDLIDQVIGTPESEFSSDRKTKMVLRPAADNFAGNPLNPSQDQSKRQKRKNDKKAKTDQRKTQQGRDSRGGDSVLQEQPLDVYTGEYSHPGYHTLTVQIKDDKLFIDATDRSMGFTLTFEHVGEQTRYIAHLEDCLEGGDDLVAAQFIFANDKAIRMGLQLEISLIEMIWFEKGAPEGSRV